MKFLNMAIAAIATALTLNTQAQEVNYSQEATSFGTITLGNAQAVRLRIYDNAQGGQAVKTVQLKKGAPDKNGYPTWATTVKGDLKGKFYTLDVKYKGKYHGECPGISAKAVGVNGRRGAIVNMAETNPAGWDTDRRPAIAHKDLIIYEMHHRDFSVSPTSGLVNKGKFLALTEAGTKNAHNQATGIDHLKELGVTHVHILPSFDYSSVDESKPEANQYNWGYDPKNYNAPEGSYSTNPADPATRIREMKEMIMTLHKAGIGVVMDVVYNHTAAGDGSNFSLTAPGYYYRHREDGSYSDASGCGNETASERQQMRDYIVRSVSDWARDYHIDGFRFDLMGIHDIETMNQVAKALKEINPNIIIYGEGWTAGDSPLPADQRLLKEKVRKTPQIAVFSDDIRDAIKGHYSNAQDRGFATGKPGLEETVKIGIVGATPHPQVHYKEGANSKFPYAHSPSQVVNYVSCHDDLCLTDKLRLSMNNPNENDWLRKRAACLAQTIVFTSQGTPFIFAGEEVFRDKKGVHNTYQSPDSVNAINWELKHANRDLFHYYTELVKLRKEHPAFRMTDPGMIARTLVFDDTQGASNLISYSLKPHANRDPWNEIKVVFNGSDKGQYVMIPDGTWRIVARNGQISSQARLGTLNGGRTLVEPYSALILTR